MLQVRLIMLLLIDISAVNYDGQNQLEHWAAGAPLPVYGFVFNRDQGASSLYIGGVH